MEVVWAAIWARMGIKDGKMPAAGMVLRDQTASNPSASAYDLLEGLVIDVAGGRRRAPSMRPG
jgi:hypothetical protein